VAFFPSEIIEHALAHKLKDEAEAAYQRGTMLMKRATLMKQWAEFCGEAALPVDIAQRTAAERRAPMPGSSPRRSERPYSCFGRGLRGEWVGTKVQIPSSELPASTEAAER
jgi:hypothetical protein